MFLSGNIKTEKGKVSLIHSRPSSRPYYAIYVRVYFQTDYSFQNAQNNSPTESLFNVFVLWLQRQYVQEQKQVS